MFDIQEELKKLPHKPGVYIMKDDDGQVIYVGKSVNLKSRVNSYFQASSQENPKVKSLSLTIAEFEYIVTNNELEALILECNLIKKHRPKFNVMLKDDKTYPYIKVTTNEYFPRIYIARRYDKDKAKYFGPYTSYMAVSTMVKLITSIWPLRKCMKKVDMNSGGRACLYHHMGQCVSPCSGSVSKTDYDRMVQEVIQFLNGRHEDLIKKMEDDMAICSDNWEFEKAAGLRDKVRAVRMLSQKQKLDVYSGSDQDIIAFARAHNEALVQVFFIRAGKMIGREQFMLNGVSGIPREEVMTEFIKQFYAEAAFIPKELILETDITDKENMLEWLKSLKGHNVAVTVPVRGDKLNLVKMAAQNAILTLDQHGERLKREEQKTVGALGEIRSALGMEKEINRIEAYDISNIQGFESVGSMIVFEGGKPKKSDYRKFKIKGEYGPNDYASMEEVILRRFSRYVNTDAEDPDASFSALPDILFMDGGKGQISAAKKSLEKLNLDIPVCGMVKDDRHRTRGLLYDGNEIEMKNNSEGFRLVGRIQDEVHRFAVEYHRKLMAKTQVKSELDDIEGIGPIRRKNLMRHFGSTDNIRAASMDQLAEVENMNKRSAETVFKHFHGE